MKSIKHPSNKTSLMFTVISWLTITMALGVVHEAFYLVSIAAFVLLLTNIFAGVSIGTALLYAVGCLLGGVVVAGILNRVK